MSENGKATASQNAMKHGMRGAAWIERRKAMTDLVRDARAMLRRFR